MALTLLDVLNRVLDLLSQTRPVSEAEFADVRPEARWFRRTIEGVVQQELRARTWTFSKATATLGKDATPPDFDYMYRYLMPTDCLRLLPVTYDGLRNGSLVPYELFGRYIHTDYEAPMPIRYIADMQDPADWDAGFAAVIVAALAMLYAPKLTGGKLNYYQIAKDAYDSALETAYTANLIEEYPDPVEAHDVIRVRNYDG